MNTKQSLVVLGTAALCGLAIAQTPKAQSAVERIEALEKEVVSLRAHVGSTRPATSEDLERLRKELADTRALANQLANWAIGQAEGAAKLSQVLDESEQKGFTFGINPESRVALLGGWRDFATGLQKDVPKALLTEPAPAAKSAKAPAAKNP